MSDTPTLRFLLFLTGVVYVFQLLTLNSNNDVYEPFRNAPPSSAVSKFFELNTEQVLHGQVWRLLTTAFCHDEFAITHIVINLLILFWLGRHIEALYGSRELLIFYLTSAIFSSLVYVLVEVLVGERHSAVGASGAVFAVMCLYTMRHPYERIYLFCIIPMQMRLAFLLYVLFDLHPLLLKFSGQDLHSGVGHAAHLGGALFGFVYYKRNWRLQPLWDRIAKLGKTTSARRAKQRGMKVFNPQSHSEDIGASSIYDSEVDVILDKIAESGIDSLSAQERSTLETASQKLRERRP